MKTKKLIVLVCMVTILATLILKESAWAQAPKKAVLKIGMTGPLSGGGIVYGYCSLGGLELAMEDINKTGGLKVGNTIYTLEAIPYDSKYLADPAVTAAKRLMYEDKVKIIFGEISSSGVLAMQTFTEANKVILFVDSSSNLVLKPEKPFTFRWYTTLWEFTRPMLAYYRQRFPQAKNFGLIYRNDDTGKTHLQCIQKYAPEKGFEVVPFPLEPGTVDMTPLVTKVLSANIDVLDVDGNPVTEVAQIVNISRGMGWNKPISRIGGSIVSEILRLCGKNGDGFIYHEDADMSHPKVEALIKRFKAKGYPTDFNNMMVPAYDGARLLFQAISKAGTVDDTVAIKNAMESIKSFEGVLGKTYWGGKDSYGIDHEMIHTGFIGEIVNGKPTIVSKH